MAVRRRRATPASGALLSQVRRRLREGWPYGLTVLGGDDLYHLDQAQRELLDFLAPEEDSEFTLSLFGEERVEVSTVVSAARSAGMFAARRVVFVRDALALDGDAIAIQDYAASPPRESYLIVRAPALDQRRKLHKTLATAGEYLRFQLPNHADPARLVADVQSMAREAGLRLDRDAAVLLAQLHGVDRYRVAAELEKLRGWSGEAKGTIGVDTVKKVASSGDALSGWEVADAVMVRDRGRALAAARRLVDSGDEPIRMVGGLAWRARLMLEAKAAGGVSNTLGRRAWGFQEGLQRSVERYRLEELLAFPAALLDADRSLKSRSIDPRAVLEELVDRLTREAGDPRMRPCGPRRDEQAAGYHRVGIDGTARREQG